MSAFHKPYKLIHDMKDCVSFIMTRAEIDRNGLWNRIPECLKKDRRVAKAVGMAHRCCQFQELSVFNCLSRICWSAFAHLHQNLILSLCKPRKYLMRQLREIMPDKHDDLTHEMKEYVVFVMARAEIDRNELWDRLPECLKKDRRVATAAIVHRCCQFQDLSVEYQTDETFLLYCVKKKPECWLSLPDRLKNDIRFAIDSLDQIHATNEKMLDDVLQRFSSNREFWKTHINKGYFKYVESDTLQTADISIRSDTALMLEACTHNPGCLAVVEASLQLDKEFLNRLLQKAPVALRYLPHEAQRQFPELVKNHLQDYFRDWRCTDDTASWLFKNVVKEFWNDRQNILCWFQSGGHFFDKMPKAWRKDKEIFLLMAKHRNDDDRYILRFASGSLQSDKHFAMGVLEYRPSLFFWFDSSVARDLDVALLGCTGFTDFRERCKRRERKSASFPKNLAAATAERVRTLLTVRKSLETWCRGMSEDSSELSRLNLGHETSLGFEKLIVDFVGDVPMGRTLWHVLAAAHNLGIEY